MHLPELMRAFFWLLRVIMLALAAALTVAGLMLFVFAELMQKAVLVTTPEYSAVRDAEKVDQVLAERGIADRGFIINKVKPELIASGAVPSVAEISGMLRIPLLGIIQYDDNIHIAANNGVPVVLKKDTYIYQNFERITERIVG